jgi:penicillin-binding protein 1B
VISRRRIAWIAVAAGIVVAGALALANIAARVHALRDMTAVGPSWSFPARLYSAGLALVAGEEIPASYLERELAVRGYMRVLRGPVPIGAYAVAPGGFEIGLRGFEDAPDPAGHGGPERVRVALARGRLAAVQRLGGYAHRPAPDLAHAPRLEPTRFATVLDDRRVRRTWVPLARIPRIVQDAVIAAEDRRFRRHSGLDLRSNARALFVNMRARGVRQGGSTLTQQLARGLFLGRERTLGRKLTEIPLALGLELLLSKDQILEMYLNSIYWGQDGSDGVAGIAEAARHYFGEPVDSLGLDEAATLAGIIPGPNALSPFRNPTLARRARNRVLGDLVAVGVIDSATAREARARPLRTRHAAPPFDRYPAFASLVRDEVARRISTAAATEEGLCVFTTLDPAWQADAERLLTRGLGELEATRGLRFGLEGAFVLLDPRTGAVRATVGGRNSDPFGFNRASQALRQPGSAIKPIVYAAALDPKRHGAPVTPATTVPDQRRSFATPEGPWTPRNDEDEYHDQVTLAKALAKSLNVATANVVEAIGASTVARYAERFGLGKLKPVASIGLGSNEVTLLGLTSAYTVFSSDGMRHEPWTIRAVVNPRGLDRTPKARDAERVLPAETAALMTGLLEDVVIFGVAYPLRKIHGFARAVAGKTGTTNDYKDAWFVGFTPQAVAGVWVGYDQPRSLGATAADIAIPVWSHIMTPLLDGFPATEFATDRTLQLAWIDPWTGGLARGDCPSPMRVPFLPGTAPTRACTKDHTSDWERIRAEAAAESLAADTTAARDSAAAHPAP